LTKSAFDIIKISTPVITE